MLPWSSTITLLLSMMLSSLWEMVTITSSTLIYHNAVTSRVNNLILPPLYLYRLNCETGAAVSAHNLPY